MRKTKIEKEESITPSETSSEPGFEEEKSADLDVHSIREEPEPPKGKYIYFTTIEKIKICNNNHINC